jgi:lipopolysaccharide/colanic/teichoic acid biosynthesis glycosyltransferase
VDVLLASVLLIVLSPLMLFVMLLIKLDSPGRPIFRQQRMGYDRRTRRQRPFTILKFRSMVKNCDESVHRSFVQRWVRGDVDPEKDAAKLTEDQRVTRVGRVLRRTSLDELPQLWNVLRGDMSLVGPRPVPLYEVEAYKRWHRKRLEVTPGITGLWQVEGRGRATVDEMARLDIEYINRQSLWLDLKILLLTIRAVISGRGAA